MSDELNSQLSAFIDDELTPEESELFVRRLCRDQTLRHTAACYGIIGDVLRGESAITAPGDFANNVMMAVEGQTVPVRTAPLPGQSSMRHWGFALAASVALAAVALMTLPGSGPGGLDTVTADVAESPPGTVAGNSVTLPEINDSRAATATLAAGNSANGRITQEVANSFAAVPLDGIAADYYNVPIVIPATAENRARLNNLLLQHLSSSGATRQPVGLRNVGFVTQTEAQR